VTGNDFVLKCWTIVLVGTDGYWRVLVTKVEG
jgi:hypothetical protein